MHRERKYRAYSKTWEKMVYFDLKDLYYQDDKIAELMMNWKPDDHIGECEDLEITEFVIKVDDTDIYEGDIFITDECTNCGHKYPEEQEQAFVVEWDGSGFRGKNLTGGFDYMFPDEPQDKIKVLGNLFENFDLVEMYYA